MRETKPKRFYKDVTVSEDDGLFVVQLDGRTARTVGRHPLGADREPLAQAIAAEWDAQTEVIELEAMPLTRLQGFALDGGENARAEWSEGVLSYLGSDLLCYRAPEPALARRQSEHWQPVLDRLGEKFGAPFAVTEGVIAVEQPAQHAAAVGEILAQLAPGELFAVKLLTEITGSAALAISISDEALDAEAAFAAARVDETYQEEIWGVDAEAAARAARLKQDFDDVVRFLMLCRG